MVFEKLTIKPREKIDERSTSVTRLEGANYVLYAPGPGVQDLSLKSALSARHSLPPCGLKSHHSSILRANN